MPELAHVRMTAAAAMIAVVLYFSGLLVMLTPLPILYASVVRGRLHGIVAALVAGVAVAALYIVAVPAGGAAATGPLSWLPLPGQGLEGFFPVAFLRAAGIGYFAFYAATALMLAEGAFRRWDLPRWGGAALAVGLAVIAAVAGWALWSGATGLEGGVRSFVLSAIQQVAEANRAAGGEAGQIAFLADRADEVATALLGLLPSIVFALALFAVVVNIIVARRLIRGHHVFAHVHNVARFRLPDAVIWGLIASGALFFIDRYAVHGGALATVGLNGLIAFGALYFLQGMAVIVYFLQGVKMPLVRTLAYVAMLIFLQTVSLALVAVGVADVWIDFRMKRWRTMHRREQ